MKRLLLAAALVVTSLSAQAGLYGTCHVVCSRPNAVGLNLCDVWGYDAKSIPKRLNQQNRGAAPNISLDSALTALRQLRARTPEMANEMLVCVSVANPAVHYSN